MTQQFTHRLMFVILLICQSSICPAAESSDPNDSTKYLDAVRTFADNVLKYGRDTYGPKHTPLFVDGLNVSTHEPVTWIEPNGDRWVLSNLTSQQNLFRTLDGLTRITGDPKYKQAAMDAIKYAFENLRSPNGLLYWGGYSAYDALSDESCGGGLHVFKAFYPYYQLMWEVDSEITKDIIESLWASHILDWSNLEMDRIGPLDRLNVSKTWEHEYKGGPVFFESWKRSVATTGSDLYYAAAILSKLSGKKEPLIWAKRLAYRYVETRDPKVGISNYIYTLHKNEPKHPLADDFKENRIEELLLFPPGIEQMLDPIVCECKLGYFIVSPDIPYTYVCNTWTCSLLVGKLLGSEETKFTQWALEELTARGKVAYRPTDNVWIPLLPDGTSLEGYGYKKDVAYGSKGTEFKPISAVPMDFWGYSLAYRLTHDKFMWEMARNIALGNGLGDIGATVKGKLKLQIPASHFDPYSILAFLQLYRETGATSFLQAAQEVGDNILTIRFHKGFFAPSSQHIYTKFDSIEALALLHLDAAMGRTALSMPQIWPGRPLFNFPFRDKGGVVDNALIYTLTESAVPPRSLQEAAACGNIEEMKSLIAEGANVNGMEGLSLYTPLYHAALHGHKEVAELLLANGAQLEALNGGQVTALHIAAERGHKELVKLLLVKGADVNAKNGSGDAPLHSAVRAGHKDIIELLITKSANLNAKNNEGQTSSDLAISRNRKDIIDLFVQKSAIPSSIHVAAQMGDLAGVKALLEQGADVNAQDDKGVTALHYAAQEGHKELVEFLIAKGADINSKDKNDYTPLYYAIWYGNKDIIKLLITKGADVNLKPEKDYPPLHYAIWDEDVGVVKLLVNHGAKFNTKDLNGWTAFRCVVSSGDRELLEFFIAKGANTSDFHTAAWLGDLNQVKRFVEQGIDVNTEDEELKWTPLHWAAFTGPQDVVEFLLAKGANVNAKDEFNSTPLQYAAVNGHKEFVELLLAKGVDVNATDNWGSTPLHAASRQGHQEVVVLLIAKGADVNPKAKNGNMPLHNASSAGQRDVVEILVANGADIDAKDKSDRTALHMAAMRGRKDMVELLIDKGADVNSKDVNGQTPLHLSARQGHRDTVELLITNGADVNAKNKWNRTPLDIATGRGHTEIVELLRKHGAN